jgi:outer membrane protein assembly factor BamB
MIKKKYWRSIMKRKQFISLILILAIIMNVLGCSSKSVLNEGGSEGAKDKDKTSAMGRYMETDFTLPIENENESLISVIQGQNGLMEIYTVSEGNDYIYYCYKQKEDNSFERSEQHWVQMETEDGNALDLGSVFYGEDGQLYAFYTVYGANWSGSIMVRVEEDRQSATVMDLAILKEKALVDGEVYSVNEEEESKSDAFTIYKSITDAAVLKNGNIVLSERVGGALYIIDATTGEEIVNLQSFVDNHSNNYTAPFCVIENKIVTVNETGDKLIAYNAESQSVEREIEISTYTADSKLAATEDDLFIFLIKKDLLIHIV